MELELSNDTLSKRLRRVEKKIKCCQCGGGSCISALDSIITNVGYVYPFEGELSIDLSAETLNSLTIPVGDNPIRIIPIVGTLAIGSTFYFSTSQFGGTSFAVVADTGVTINGTTDYFLAFGFGGIVKLVYQGDDAWTLEPVCNILRIIID